MLCGDLEWNAVLGDASYAICIRSSLGAREQHFNSYSFQGKIPKRYNHVQEEAKCEDRVQRLPQICLTSSRSSHLRRCARQTEGKQQTR
jgi:hypothetical protein